MTFPALLVTQKRDRTSGDRSRPPTLGKEYFFVYFFAKSTPVPVWTKKHGRQEPPASFPRFTKSAAFISFHKENFLLF